MMGFVTDLASIEFWDAACIVSVGPAQHTQHSLPGIHSATWPTTCRTTHTQHCMPTTYPIHNPTSFVYNTTFQECLKNVRQVMNDSPVDPQFCKAYPRSLFFKWVGSSANAPVQKKNQRLVGVYCVDLVWFESSFRDWFVKKPWYCWYRSPMMLATLWDDARPPETIQNPQKIQATIFTFILFGTRGCDEQTQKINPKGKQHLWTYD